MNVFGNHLPNYKRLSPFGSRLVHTIYRVHNFSGLPYFRRTYCTDSHKKARGPEFGSKSKCVVGKKGVCGRVFLEDVVVSNGSAYCGDNDGKR